jgi:threonine/homoserine/homoserine lactone efflux protein
MTANFGIFLASAVGISLSGVMAPGPVMVATITKGYNNQNAGALIGLGHGIIEIPIIALLYFGVAAFINVPGVKQVIGVLGGLMLLFMGWMILRSLGKQQGNGADLPYNPLITGVITTGVNPYFYLWWATVGLSLIAGSAEFGIAGLVAFVAAHWGCDIGWDQAISFTVFRTKRFWNVKVRKIVFAACALVLMGFGLWNAISVFFL